MERLIRRTVIGAIAGVVASVPVLTGPTPDAYLDNMFTAGAYDLPLWAVISVIALPLLSGQMPEWSAEQMRSHFPILRGEAKRY